MSSTESMPSKADRLFEIRDEIFNALEVEIMTMKEVKKESPSFLSPTLDLLKDSKVSHQEMVELITTVRMPWAWIAKSFLVIVLFF